MTLPTGTQPTLSREDESQIWKFIHREVCNNGSYKEVKPSLFMKYIEESGTAFDAEHLFKIYNTIMVHDLYNAKLSSLEVLELYKFLEITITQNMQEEMESRFDAILILNDYNRLHMWHYNVPDVMFGNIKAEVVENTEKPVNKEEEYDLEDDETATEQAVDLLEIEIWKYIGENFDGITSEKLASLQFWEMMLAEKEDLKQFNKSAFQLLRLFQGTLLEARFWCQKFNVKRKLEMIREMRLPLDFNKYSWFWVKEQVQLERSEDGYVISWKFMNDELNDENEQVVEILEEEEKKEEQDSIKLTPRILRRKSAPAKLRETTSVNNTRNNSTFSVTRKVKSEVEKQRNPFTRKEDWNAWKYVLKRILEVEADDKTLKKEEVKPKGLTFWLDYISYSNSDRTADNWCSHFRKIMCRELHYTKFSRANILKLYAHLNLKVDKELENFLEKKFKAIIMLDSNRFIETWVFKDKYPGPNDHEDKDIESEDDEEVKNESDVSKSDDEVGVGQDASTSDKRPTCSVKNNRRKSTKQRRSRVETDSDMDSEADSVLEPLRRQKRRRYEIESSEEEESYENVDVEKTKRNSRKESRSIVETSSSSDEDNDDVPAKRTLRSKKKSGGKNETPLSSSGRNRGRPRKDGPASRTRGKTQN